MLLLLHRHYGMEEVMGSAAQQGHTPGSWEAVGALVRDSRDADGSGGFLIAECSLHQPEAHTNARLIAAVPEMLAACRVAFDATLNAPHGGPTWVAHQRLKAALEKAELGHVRTAEAA